MCISSCTIIRIWSTRNVISRHRMRTRIILTTRIRNRLLNIASYRLIRIMIHIMRLISHIIIIVMLIISSRSRTHLNSRSTHSVIRISGGRRMMSLITSIRIIRRTRARIRIRIRIRIIRIITGMRISFSLTSITNITISLSISLSLSLSLYYLVCSLY